MRFPEQTEKKAVEQLVSLYLPADCMEAKPVARRATMLVVILFSAGIWFLVSGCLSPRRNQIGNGNSTAPSIDPLTPSIRVIFDPSLSRSTAIIAVSLLIKA